MEWSGGVACSEVTDGVASCVTAVAVRIPASDTLLASTGILPVGVLCVTEIPTVSTLYLRHAHSCVSNAGKTFLTVAAFPSCVSDAFFFLPHRRCRAVTLVLPPHQNATKVNTRTQRNVAVNPQIYVS